MVRDHIVLLQWIDPSKIALDQLCEYPTLKPYIRSINGKNKIGIFGLQMNDSCLIFN